MSSEEDVILLEEFRLPELIQCEEPRPAEVATEFLESWLQHSSVGQNVRALQDIETRLNAASTDIVQTKPEANGKETKSKGRVRKASNLGGEKSAKKSSSQPISPPRPVVTFSSSDDVDNKGGVCWSSSDDQIIAVLQKVLALELQQAGFDSIENRALEVFTDVTVRYISKLARNLRVVLDRYASLTVDTKSLWNTWLRSMNVSLTELPLFVHHDVIATRQRLDAAALSEIDKVPHEHFPLAALVQEHKQNLEVFQQQSVRLSRQRGQPASPPRDYSAYFDPSSVEANASNFQYSLDSFPHLASLPPNMDPTEPSFSYPTPYPFYGASPSFEPDKPSFYGYVQPNTLSPGTSSSIIPFPPRHDPRV